MEPGQPILFVPVVLEGSIKIVRAGTNPNNPDEAELLLYYLNAADSCAISLSGMLAHEQSTIRAVAEERTQLLMIPVEQADNWMRFASWRAFVLKTYQKRFDNLLETLDSVAFRQLDERLLAYLKQRAQLAEGRHLYLTHEAISRDLNTSREVISRLLKQLERRGYVTLSRNKISLLA